jgi:hypothetical protein
MPSSLRGAEGDDVSAGADNRFLGLSTKCSQIAQPWTTDFAIMQWMPLEPLTVWVTRRSAARLHSV